MHGVHKQASPPIFQLTNHMHIHTYARTHAQPQMRKEEKVATIARAAAVFRMAAAAKAFRTWQDNWDRTKRARLLLVRCTKGGPFCTWRQVCSYSRRIWMYAAHACQSICVGLSSLRVFCEYAAWIACRIDSADDGSTCTDATAKDLMSCVCTESIYVYALLRIAPTHRRCLL